MSWLDTMVKLEDRRRKTPREKLAILLEEAGFYPIRPPERHRESPRTADGPRWHAYALQRDIEVHLCGWSTMTECARYGLVICDVDKTEYEVYADIPAPTNKEHPHG